MNGIDYNSVKGTKDEIAFDVFNIDTKNRIIYSTRFGRGEDREVKY